MEFFRGVQMVRLRSVHGKYVVRNEDGENVSLQPDGSSRNAEWLVEVSRDEDGKEGVRLRSATFVYLVPLHTEKPGLAGMKVVLQPWPDVLDYAEWTPTRVGDSVKLKEWSGSYLRANAYFWPWHNSVTASHRPKLPFIRPWLLWRVEEVMIGTRAPAWIAPARQTINRTATSTSTSRSAAGYSRQNMV